VQEAREVVVVGDGAHWIWNLAELHFPGATQIVDWYHASQYVWGAATAIWGDTHPRRAAWAQRQLDYLWAGQVAEVLAALEPYQAAGEGVTAALSYYTTHRARMDYAAYRARGLQIGSGSVESGCKQLVSARLKGAGMIWEAPGAEAVATVRAWLKSERWAEAMALRPPRVRRYQRRQPAAAPVGGTALEPQLPTEVVAQVRAELAAERAQHPWRKAWSHKRQQAQHTAPSQAGRTALVA
jgi:hypothetical protein